MQLYRFRQGLGPCVPALLPVSTVAKAGGSWVLMALAHTPEMLGLLWAWLAAFPGLPGSSPAPLASPVSVAERLPALGVMSTCNAGPNLPSCRGRSVHSGQPPSFQSGISWGSPPPQSPVCCVSAPRPAAARGSGGQASWQFSFFLLAVCLWAGGSASRRLHCFRVPVSQRTLGVGLGWQHWGWLLA